MRLAWVCWGLGRKGWSPDRASTVSKSCATLVRKCGAFWGGWSFFFFLFFFLLPFFFFFLVFLAFARKTTIPSVFSKDSYYSSSD